MFDISKEDESLNELEKFINYVLLQKRDDYFEDTFWKCSFSENNIFSFKHKIKKVELSFRVDMMGTDIILINYHRISKIKRKGFATLCLNQIILLFINYSKSHNFKHLGVIFEIQNKFETKPEETKSWLIKLGYQKTKDLVPEKYFKVYSL